MQPIRSDRIVDNSSDFHQLSVIKYIKARLPMRYDQRTSTYMHARLLFLLVLLFTIHCGISNAFIFLCAFVAHNLFGSG